MAPARDELTDPKVLKRAHIRSQIPIPQRSRLRLCESAEGRLCLICHVVNDYRRSHNPKVGGSNPPPATNLFNHLPDPLKVQFNVCGTLKFHYCTCDESTGTASALAISASRHARRLFCTYCSFVLPCDKARGIGGMTGARSR